MTPIHRLVTSLLSALLLAGCASETPYDYGLGLEVIRMDEHTRDLLSMRSSRPLPAPEAKRYLRDSMATLQLLHDRGVGHQTETPEAHLVEFLRRRFEQLAAQKAPITRRDIARLAPDIVDLRDLESRKGTEWHGDPGVSVFSSDSSFDTDDVTYANRRGDRSDHHGGRDSDQRGHDRSDHGHHESQGDHGQKGEDKKS